MTIYQIKEMINKILELFNSKYRLINAWKYYITPVSSNTLEFKLTEKQQKKVNELLEKYGSMDYCFYFIEDSLRFKVKIWKTGEWIDVN